MTTLERLHLVPIFNHLKEEDLALIERIVKRVRYYREAPICQQGELGVALYIVESGAVQMVHVDSRGKQRTLEVKHAGDFFGETALLFGEPFPTSFVAEEDSDILVVRRDEFYELMLQYPEVYQRWRNGLPPTYQAQLRQPWFAWLMEGEVVILHARKHWWAFVRELPTALAIILGALVIAIVAMAFVPNVVVKILAWAIALLIVSLTLVYQTIDWRNDDYILTNRRVIHIERVLLLRVERREATLDKVQHVEINQPTLLQKIVGVSDVLISTAAVHGTITFAKVANGTAIKNAILEQIQRAQAQRMFESRSKLKNEIRAELERGSKPIGVRPPSATPSAPKAPPPQTPLQHAIRERFAQRVVFGNTITWRKHGFALLVQAWKPLAGIGVEVIGLVLTALGFFPTLTWALLAVVLLVVGGWFVWEFVDWSNDIYQLTPDRIVDVERTPLGVIQHSVEAPLAQVQHVAYRQPNVFAVLIGIGDVVIETAGQSGQMIFHWVSSPAQVANEILQAVERLRERQQTAQRAAQRAEMLEWLSAYHSYLEEAERLRRTESPPPVDTNDLWS